MKSNLIQFAFKPSSLANAVELALVWQVDEKPGSV